MTDDHHAERRCPECTNPVPAYEFGRPRRFCSPACAKRVHKRIGRKEARARAKGVIIVDRVDPLIVFNRDRWRCRACDTPTPREKRGSFEHDEPTIDHHIPLGAGGEHSYANVRLLCRRCNERKSKADARAAARSRGLPAGRGASRGEGGQKV